MACWVIGILTKLLSPLTHKVLWPKSRLAQRPILRLVKVVVTDLGFTASTLHAHTVEAKGKGFTE